MAEPTHQPILTQRYDAALAYAAEKHRFQRRKGSGTPYLSHLLAVSAIAMEYGATEDEAIAALLHDTIEDCGGAPIYLEMRDKFGLRVADIVQACSDTDEDPKPPWLARKQHYLEALGKKDRSSQLVSAADKLHNMRSLLQDYGRVGEALWDRFKAGRNGTLWYYRSLVKGFQQSGKLPAAVLEDLEATMSELEARVGHQEAPHPAVPFVSPRAVDH